MQDDRGLTVVDHVSLTVRAGEVVALAGVQGNGQTELAEAVTRLRAVAGGTIRLAGQDLTHATPRHALRAGVAHIPEDRQVDGLVLSMSIADNLVLDVYNQEPNAHFGARDLATGAHATASASWPSSTSGPARSTRRVATLSGGNQQKVVVARELSRPVTLLVAAQPTRGLDVGLDRVRPPPDHRRARPGGSRAARLL